MQRNYISSSNLASVGWKNGILEAEFHDGDVYQCNVPEYIYQGLRNAHSKGSYFHHYIREAYLCREVA